MQQLPTKEKIFTIVKQAKISDGNSHQDSLDLGYIARTSLIRGFELHLEIGCCMAFVKKVSTVMRDFSEPRERIRAA
jgi:hypothetical protein